ncbi:MAG: aminotransferase class V-fold PLP-dependent enzyme [Chloroherpetonaceae bacterium]|nr:aminotransferase class V-fold PLP-dependent enzyme [Chloroherpetonaceae bacterium]
MISNQSVLNFSQKPLQTGIALQFITESYRSNFPHLSNQKYYNHAAVSPLSNRVVQAVKSQLHEWNNGDIENYLTDLMPLSNVLRNRVARLIEANSSNVAFIPNTSYGLNVLAQGLKWNAGDRILLYEQDFPSNIYPFLNLKAKGVEIDFIPYTDGTVSLEAIQQRLTPKTKLLSLSYVQYITGARIDLKQVSETCHRNGTLFSVDAIQAIGAMPISCIESQIDFLAAGCHKWGMSPMGTGFLYISDQLLERIETSFWGWLSVEEPWDLMNFNQSLRKEAKRFELGTYNWAGLAGMNEAFTIFEEIGKFNLEQKLLDLSETLINELEDKGLRCVLKNAVNQRSGIVSVNGFENPDRVVSQLLEKKIEVSARGGVLRISPHFYNSLDEMKELALEIKSVVNH